MKITIPAVALVALSSFAATVNAAGYQGWWWSAATDGMGLNVEQQGDTMAVAWYHFGEDRSPAYVLLAGKPVDGVLSGELQAASGPPPGPGYNPADVARHAVGAATLTFRPPASGSSQATATFEYTLNGRSGSFELARFAMQPTPLTGSWRAFYGHRAYRAIMENTGGNHYRLQAGWHGQYGDFNGYDTFDLELDGPGPVFTGKGRLWNPDGTEGMVEVKRLQVENGILIFDYVSTVSAENGVAVEPPAIAPGTLVGFPPPNAGAPEIEGAAFYQSGWWWDPSKDGMGLNIEQQGDTVAATWYHFDENRSPGYALLAGKMTKKAGNDVLTGALQTASGPPPGPDYNPADVSRDTAGSATLTFNSPTSARFEYTLNSRSGSLNLSRFTMGQEPPATGTWKYRSAYVAWACFVIDTVPSLAGTASGMATMEKTGDGLYRLSTQDDNGIESCTYDLELTRSGPFFTGNGQGSCIDHAGRPVTLASVAVRRLQTENGTLVFDYTTSANTSVDGYGYGHQINSEDFESCSDFGSLSGVPHDSARP